MVFPHREEGWEVEKQGEGRGGEEKREARRTEGEENAMTEPSAILNPPPSSIVGATPFTEDYYLRGPASGLSNYENYSWQAHLTVPVCKLIMRYLGAEKGDSVLDYGCARGYYVKALIGLGYEAYGYDVSEWAIENCDPAVRSFCFYARPPAPSSAADYILCKDVLEHIALPELEKVVKSFIDMTRKAALIIVPLANAECGMRKDEERTYVSPVDNQDATHKIAWTLDEWLMFIQGVIDASGRAFTISGSYKMPGVKRAADPWPRSCGFFVLRRFEYE